MPAAAAQLYGRINGGGNTASYYAGSGGGATDIRTVNGAITATNRLVVAGGGGGGGYNGVAYGGDGGGLIGANGYSAGSNSFPQVILLPVVHKVLVEYPEQAIVQVPGVGTLGVGGNGYNYPSCYYCGGGGGGYYGGGGAGYYGGGGGGSSYTNPANVNVVSVTHTQGYNLLTSFTGGNGVVILCPLPTIGSITVPSSICSGYPTPLSITGTATGGPGTPAMRLLPPLELLQV